MLINKLKMVAFLKPTVFLGGPSVRPRFLVQNVLEQEQIMRNAH